MEGIKTYLEVINPHYLKHLTGKPSQFIRLFQECPHLSEEAFRRKICGSNCSESYYRTLKSRTKKILQILAIFSPAKGASEAKKKYDNCKIFFVTGQNFLTQGKIKEGIRLIKRAWQIATDYDFTYLACELSSILFHNYVYYQKNIRKAKFYSDQVDFYLDNYVAEKKVEKYFYLMIAQKDRPSQLIALEKAITASEDYPAQSIKYKMYRASLIITYCFHRINYKRIIQICNQTLTIFKGKKGIHSSHIQFLYSKRGLAQMAVKKYVEAEDSFNIASSLTPKKSFNDYLNLLYKTINFLHSKAYDQAYQLYWKNKKCPFENLRQQFAIIEAYLYFLTHLGYLPNKQKFRLGKYLNETVKAQSNKQESNINILIAELLIYLVKSKSKFIDRVESIDTYSYRYLKEKDTKRAKRFFKVLCTIPRANFNAKALQRLTKTQITYIDQHPIFIEDNISIEIIPFEDLLDMIMQHLERKAA